MIERKLDDIATANGFWASVSRQAMVQAEDCGFEESIDHYADFIALTIVKGIVDVKDIRDEASAFNDLDAQTVDIVGVDLDQLDGVDYIEGMSRRVVHHILREGLNRVKTQNDRIAFRNKNPFSKIEEGPMPGMGGLEGHDIRALREGAEQVELGKD